MTSIVRKYKISGKTKQWLFWCKFYFLCYTFFLLLFVAGVASVPKQIEDLRFVSTVYNTLLELEPPLFKKKYRLMEMFEIKKKSIVSRIG